MCLKHTGQFLIGKMKIAIIGAGAGGLVSARRLKVRPKEFQVTVFEQSGRVGGVWAYNKSDSEELQKGVPKTSMYKNLRTNLPTCTMEFLDFPFPKNVPCFPHHSEIFKYLDAYAKYYNIYDLIKFYTKVNLIRPVDGNCYSTKWEVTTVNIISKTESVDTFDVVLICNGNYSTPSSPEISNIEEFKGQIIHSIDYEEPSEFADKNVLCLGAGNSGMDIAIELLSTAKKVYLSHRSTEPIGALTTTNIVQIPGIERANENGFIDSSGQHHPTDVLILCTGYQYNYPFLHPDCGIEVRHGGKMVYPLYRHMINIRHPSMAFIGIPFGILPFPLMDFQIQFFIRTLDDIVHLRPRDEMLEDLEDEIKEMAEKGIPLRFAHKLGDLQWKYNEDLCVVAGLQQMPPAKEMIYKACRNMRKQNEAEYRNYIFVATSPSKYEVYYKKGGNRPKQ